MVVSFTVNGETFEVPVKPKETLAEVLREKMGLRGTKIGCDSGTCGACTVLVEGKPILSCLTLAITVRGKKILTIEGISRNGKLHPVQEAFIECGAVQCGFCTPGMIMVTKAFLDEKPNPTEEEVREALTGNICRCTGYAKIVEAVMRASKKLRGGE